MCFSKHEKIKLFHELEILRIQQRHFISYIYQIEDTLMKEFDDFKGDVKGLVDGVAAAVVALDDIKAKLDQAIAAGSGVTVADVLALDQMVKDAKASLAGAVLRDDPPVVVVDPAPPVEPPVDDAP